MKKLLVLFLALFLITIVKATNISISNAGDLSALLPATTKTSLTELVVSGTIDARDIKCMRDELPRLTKLDISGATIQSYNGEGGPLLGSVEYPANEMPQNSFFNRTTYDGKTTLKVIALPKNLVSIGHFAFYHCYNLVVAQIPDNVSTIGDYAFNFCSKLPSVTISKSVTSIGKYTFSACSSISGFIVHPENQNYSAIDGVLYDKYQTVLIECPESKKGDFVMPSTVTSIANNAFFQCSSITSLTIPRSVTSIGSQAFYNCSGLTNINAAPPVPVVLKTGSNVFFNVNKSTCLLQVFVGAAGAYQTANQWKEFTKISDLKSVEIVAGGLCNALTAEERAAVTKLSIKGLVDARDFKCIRDEMPSLVFLDLNEATIAAYSGPDGTEGAMGVYGAYCLPAHAFSNERSTKLHLQTVILPPTLVSVGKQAFSKCVALTEITLPRYVNGIDATAFDGCTALQKINVDPLNLKFSSVDGLLMDKNQSTLVKCPDGKKETCNIPATVVNIDPKAFWGCDNLKSIFFGAGVNSITNALFVNCKSLNKIGVAPENINYSSLDGVLYNKNKTVLLSFPMSKTAVFFVPKSVSSIAEKAFQGCIGLTGITIPSSVTAIGERAFSGCVALKSIFVNNPLPIAFGVNSAIFEQVDKRNCVLHVPSGLAEVYVAATQWKDFENIVDALTINNVAGSLKKNLTPEELLSVTKLTITGTIDATDIKCLRDEMPQLTVLDISAATIIGYSGSLGTTAGQTVYPANILPANAFYDGKNAKTSLKTIYLPIYLSAVGNEAFMNCTGLAKIKIPTTVVQIGKLAFSGCSNLLDISVEIDNANFSSVNGVLFNKNITSLICFPQAKKGAYTVPESVVDIANFAFSGCKNLTDVILGNAVKTIGEGAFSHCVALQSVVFPTSVVSLGSSAFLQCDNLRFVQLNNGIKTIGENAFYSCAQLNSISIPASVQTIGTQCFGKCDALAEYQVSGDNMNFSVTDGVLYNKSRSVLISCPKAKQGALVLPNSVESIADNAFFECSKLYSISLPTSVNAIGTKAFYGCTALRAMDISNDNPIVFKHQQDVFQGVDLSNCLLHVPVGSVNSYMSTRFWKDFSNITDLKSITVNPGTISASLTPKELLKITQLVVSGTMDARDFKCLRDSMPCLKMVDLSAVNIKSYRGLGGTSATINSYSANELPPYAFGNDSIVNKFLTNIVLPKTLTAIGNGAFTNCSKLLSLTFPTSFNSMGDGVFNGCKSIGQFVVEPNNRNFTAIDGVLFNRNQSALILYPKGRKGAYILPNSVSTILEGVFNDCDELTSITLPKSVNTIRNEAFGNCNKLVSIYVNTPHPIGLKQNSGVFKNIDKSLCVLHVPPKSIPAYRNVQQWQDFDKITDEKVVTVQAGGLFSSLTYEERTTITNLVVMGRIDARDFKCLRDELPLLTTLDLSNSTIQAYSGKEGSIPYYTKYNEHELPQWAFAKGTSGCNQLKNIILPSNIKAIGNNAFSFCEGLVKVEMPTTLQSIGDASFLYCTGLTSIVLPDAVTTIGKNAFYKCVSLKTIELGTSLNTIGKEAFSNCVLLDNLKLPTHLKELQSRALEACVSLKSILLPSSLTSIGYRVFQGCYQLTEINVQPDNKNYSSLEGILFDKNKTQLISYPRAKSGAYIVPNSVSTIADFAFMNCSNLNQITIPSGVKHIGGWAFSFCTKLTKVNLPATVSTLGNQAFGNCSALMSVSLNGATPLALSPGSDVFVNVDKTKCVLSVPAVTLKFYKVAKQWQDFENVVKKY